MPFLLSGLLFTRGLASLAPLRRHTPLLIRASGVMLMVLGVLLALGQMTAITSELVECVPGAGVAITTRSSCRRMTRAARPQA